MARGHLRRGRYLIIIFRDAHDRLAREAAQQESAALRSVTELANAAAHEIYNLSMLDIKKSGGPDPPPRA